MTVEFFGAIRLKAGMASFETDAGSLGDAFRQLARAIPALDGTVIVGGRLHPAYRASLDGDRFVSDPETAIGPDAHLLLLAADVGG